LAGGAQFCNVAVTCGRSWDSVARIRHPYVSSGVYRIAETKTSRNVGADRGVGGTPSSTTGKSQWDAYQKKTQCKKKAIAIKTNGRRFHNYSKIKVQASPEIDSSKLELKYKTAGQRCADISGSVSLTGLNFGPANHPSLLQIHKKTE
jgi:hypothetical protein